MVRIFTSEQKAALENAIARAEHQTSAEIVAVVSPASDSYLSYMLLYGFTLGCLISLGLWKTALLVVYPYLLMVQLGVTALIVFLPWLRHPLMVLVPRQIKHHRAAHRAFGEYLSVTGHLPSTTPVVVFYVSLAEHYAHILPSRSVREKISEETWNEVIQEFTHVMKQKRLHEACIQAVQHIAELLIPQFPDQGGRNVLSDKIRG